MRLSKRESRILEALEGAAGLLGVGLRTDLELLALRLSDLRRRMPEYRRLIGLAETMVGICQDERQRAHALVSEVLETWQKERNAETRRLRDKE